MSTPLIRAAPSITLPAGSDVEITLKINKSRNLFLEAYFPLLDTEFPMQVNVEKTIANASEIVTSLRDEKKRLENLKEKAEESGESDLVEDLERLESDRELDEAARAAKDPAAAEKAQARLLDLQIKLDAAEEKLKWPALVTEARELQEELSDLAQEHGKGTNQEKVEDWSELIDSIITKKQTERLAKRIEEGRVLFAQILFSLPSFWVGQFQRLDRERHKFADASAADRLLERGRNYLQQNNVEGLTDVVRKLWDLLPREEAEKARRGIGAAIQ